MRKRAPFSRKKTIKSEYNVSAREMLKIKKDLQWLDEQFGDMHTKGYHSTKGGLLPGKEKDPE